MLLLSFLLFSFSFLGSLVEERVNRDHNLLPASLFRAIERRESRRVSLSLSPRPFHLSLSRSLSLSLKPKPAQPLQSLSITSPPFNLSTSSPTAIPCPTWPPWPDSTTTSCRPRLGSY
ncbi:hypothetical protein BDY24DRAFT_3583 [Mrakia frigida]|uniref:uncharacterized protein n=1 Tax=Mrakia frigida TaxID=29902 RepID=UPI003FCBFFF4